MSRPLVVTGAAGQLGVEILRLLGDRPVTALTRAELDLTDPVAVREAMVALAPEAVINCAAMTDVDGCESDPAAAFAANAWAVRNLARAAEATGAHLVHVSTDYVFSGRLGRPHHEWDLTDPEAVYGRSKLAGEHELAPSATIARTAWLAGATGSSIVATVLRLADADPHRQLAFVEDQIGSPSFADDVAGRIVELCDARLSGVHHVVSSGQASWYDVARATLDASGHTSVRLRAITTAELDPPRPAPRPADSRLEPLASRLAGLDDLPDWRDGLARLVARMRAAA